jgi:hypothetical protein
MSKNKTTRTDKGYQIQIDYNLKDYSSIVSEKGSERNQNAKIISIHSVSERQKRDLINQILARTPSF